MRIWVDIKNELSKTFKIDEGDVVVTAPLVGGAFGGKAPVHLYPALAIILEGMAVFGAFMFVERKGKKFGYLEALFVSSAWRILFTSIQFATLSPADFPSFPSVVRFILIDSVVNSLLIYIYIRLVKPREGMKGRAIRPINPIASAVALVLSILSKWVI